MSGPGMASVSSPSGPDPAVAGPALEAIDLSKRYRGGAPWALKDVRMAIPQGSITALVGPNGAGKSTLIRTWVGFETPSSGSVRVLGVDPRQDRAGAIERLGYVSQSTGLYRGLSVADHLALAGTLRAGFDADLARARLDQLGIPLSQRAGTLSGGQASQVALCIALGTRAPVLLLDEPLASLDPLARHDFLNVLVAAVRENGATALLSSHIVSDVEAACDQIVVLGTGRVTLQGTIAQVVAQHRLAPVGTVDPQTVVATFDRPGGASTLLVRSGDPALQTPTLEELVMGYLSAARADGARAAAAARDGRAA